MMSILDYVRHVASLKNIMMGGVDIGEPWSTTIQVVTCHKVIQITKHKRVKAMQDQKIMSNQPLDVDRAYVLGI